MEEYPLRRYLLEVQRIAQNPHLSGELGFRRLLRRGASQGKVIGMDIPNTRVMLEAPDGQALVKLREEGNVIAPANYRVTSYSFHFQLGLTVFRFDSHEKDGTFRPHANRGDADHDHLYYDEKFCLDTADLNVCLMLELVHCYLQTRRDPLERDNWAEYNRLLVQWRDQLR